MKHYFKKLIVVFILLKTSDIYAQRDYQLAICANGILLGGYNRTLHSIPDTISIEDAKSIFMIDALWIQKDRIASRIIIEEFQMTIYDKADSISVKSYSPYLTDEMKNNLNKIKSGSKLFFEGIIGRVSTSADNAMTLTFLPFIIR